MIGRAAGRIAAAAGRVARVGSKGATRTKVTVVKKTTTTTAAAKTSTSTAAKTTGSTAAKTTGSTAAKTTGSTAGKTTGGGGRIMDTLGTAATVGGLASLILPFTGLMSGPLGEALGPVGDAFDSATGAIADFLGIDEMKSKAGSVVSLICCCLVFLSSMVAVLKFA